MGGCILAESQLFYKLVFVCEGVRDEMEMNRLSAITKKTLKTEACISKGDRLYHHENPAVV